MQNIFLNQQISTFSGFLLAVMLVFLAGCGSGTTPEEGTAANTAAVLQLKASSLSVPSDDSAPTTITVTALNASNAALSGIVVTLSTDTGILGAPTVTTGSDGTATFTFHSGTASLANRTATITASAGASAQIPIQISGSTLSVFSATGSNVPNDGTSPVTVTFIAKNAVGTGLSGVPFTASWATNTGGQLTVSPLSGVTNSAGKFEITVAGTAASFGTATVLAAAAGSTASTEITVTAVAGTFGISSTTLNAGTPVPNPTTASMQTGDALTVTVSAPSSANVTFTTSMGTWVGGTTTKTVVVGGGVASAVLNQTLAGVATVQVNDSATPTLADNLTVGITASTPYKVTLTASPTVVAITTGSSVGTSTLIAKVLDLNNQPVGNVPVAFSMTDTTGGGESVSPVVAYTAATIGGGLGLGEASATFTSGSLSSSSYGVKIRASVQGTAVATNTAPSSNDAAIVIGGLAGSIAFGISTKIESPNTTTYKLPMSVLVADAGGNPLVGAVVTLSTWPIAWSTGVDAACAPDLDNGSNKGTFYNEDLNGNLSLDALEDGYRKYYVNGLGGAVVLGGTKDGLITPVNSAAGSLPSTVVTDANGLANFYLTYLKTSAIWTHDRIRASTVVAGTESVSQIVFQLPAAIEDAGTTCYLAAPYHF